MLETSNPFVQMYYEIYWEEKYADFLKNWPKPIETEEERAEQQKAWVEYMESIL